MHLTTRPRPGSFPSDPSSSIATYTTPSGVAATAVGYITSGGIANTVTSNFSGPLIPFKIDSTVSGGVCDFGAAPTTDAAARTTALTNDQRARSIIGETPSEKGKTALALP